MPKVTRHMVWTAGNVSSFRGFDINEAGQVELSDAEYVSYLNEMYGTVEVCGQTFDSGSLLQDADPTAFDCGKSQYESELTDDFEQALENEDESEIKFSQYEPFEIDEDEEDAEEADE